MSIAVDIAVARISLPTEEGFRAYPYDDATGLRVHAPRGNVTVAYGYNLDAGTSQELGKVILAWFLNNLEELLLPRAWYAKANAARKSVFLDIGFNEGLHGLLDFPSMIHYASVDDWVNASAQCSVRPTEPPGVIARYKRLADILLSGVDNATTQTSYSNSTSDSSGMR